MNERDDFSTWLIDQGWSPSEPELATESREDDPWANFDLGASALTPEQRQYLVGLPSVRLDGIDDPFSAFDERRRDRQ